MRSKVLAFLLVVGLVAVAVYTYETREANPYCKNGVTELNAAPCQKYEYWWDH